ncbi:hypothetical protein BT63DRAFT_418942 [Microthyrium microscopicum]|uniref:Phosphatases II n=1 Tax=Microthyrium microscopicum TaxID=703497 RepID=A0A6A6TWY6_9PEZI|nr:hypothetical protein BT63DRAFT_418942 [Microthyrium microscopicum]
MDNPQSNNALAIPGPTLSSSPSPTSSRASSRARASHEYADAQTDARARDTDESSPLPAFLRQNRLDLHNKFIDLEWQQRERLHLSDHSGDATAQFARFKSDEVGARNRYLNVDPYKNNRIRLKVPEGHNDYINASPIKLPPTAGGEDKYFIATQGPKSDSYSHIWRMIWDETADPAVIVMLTQTHESGKEKCFQYFPLDADDETLPINEHDEFGDGFTGTLTLKHLDEDKSTRSIIRELELRAADGRTKTVWHLLFGGWPDFLVPEGEDRAALVRLVRLSQQKNAAHPGSPRIVHCSAGVGRTGTFAALDWLLAELESGALDDVGEEEDPIAELVDRLRQQRMMMVQGDTQFVFLYDLLKELWMERWKARTGESAATVESS